MSFYSTFTGTNFREWVVSIANFLGKYVDDIYILKRHLLQKNYFKTYQTHSYLLLRQLEEPIHAHPRRHLYHLLVSRIPYTLSTCTNFSCFQLFIPERKKKGFSRVLFFANLGQKTRNSRKLVPAKISTPKVMRMCKFLSLS